ncbi:MAG: hypothetical protein U1F36_07160 [Planctomycetota bacterium]
MPRLPDLGNTLLLLGLVAVGLSGVLPIWNGERVARVESRAVEVAEELHALCPAPQDFAALDAAEWHSLAEQLRARCTGRGQPDSDLPELLDSAEGPRTFGNRHYLFRILPRPRPLSHLQAEDANPAPLDVYAWPRTLLPPGRSVFCVTQEGLRNFTRNLVSNYAGLDHGPPAGAAEPRTDTEDPTHSIDNSYRSVTGERWIRF